MGTIVSSFFISLDGVVQSPDQWHVPDWNDEMSDAVTKSREATEAMLMSRVLYDEWASCWPTRDDEPIATTFNEMPKHVVSKTLSEATWNTTTLINGDIAAGIRDLKDRTDGVIGVSGSATLAARQRSPRPARSARAPDRRRYRPTPLRQYAHPSTATRDRGDLQHGSAQRLLPPGRQLKPMRESPTS